MTLPKRDQIADALRLGITEGVYHEGEKLPTLDDIQAAFRVSRGTAMAAIGELEAAGLVEQRLGRNGGAFVRRRIMVDVYAWRDDQPMSNISEKDLFFRTITEQGHTPTQDFSTRVESMPADYGRLLHVDAGSPAYVRRCIRYVDSIPHSIQDSWYPAWLCDRVPALASPANITQGTTKLLADEGFVQVAAFGETTAHMPTPDEAAILRIRLTGRPVLRSVLTGYTVDGPLRISTATFDADKTRLVSAHGDTSVIERYRR